MFDRYRDDRPKTYFTNITSQITMPWNRPCCSYQLQIFGEYAQICFRKIQKISRSKLNRLGDIQEKNRGVDKNNPPAIRPFSRDVTKCFRKWERKWRPKRTLGAARGHFGARSGHVPSGHVRH